jgi:cell division protein FtsB
LFFFSYESHARQLVQQLESTQRQLEASRRDADELRDMKAELERELSDLKIHIRGTVILFFIQA